MTLFSHIGAYVYYRGKASCRVKEDVTSVTFHAIPDPIPFMNEVGLLLRSEDLDAKSSHSAVAYELIFYLPARVRSSQ